MNEVDITSASNIKLAIFVLLAGMIGDTIIHFLLRFKWWPQGLSGYYKSLEYGSTRLTKAVSSWIVSAFLGGAACVIGLILGQWLMNMYDRANEYIGYTK